MSCKAGTGEGTDHDLRITAPLYKNVLGTTVQDGGLCNACHAAHNAPQKQFLWAAPIGPATLDAWKAQAGYPDSVMIKLCTGCHAPGKSAEQKIPQLALHPAAIGSPASSKQPATMTINYNFMKDQDLRGRSEILKVHTKKVPLAADVELEKIAPGTPGFSGADLENLVKEAALWAARWNKKEVEVIDFEMAKDKVLMGAERKSMVLSDEEKRTTAYHEAGHALMAKLLPGTDPVHKVTIIPRGRALGVTMQLPTDDRHNYSKDFLYNNLAILMGGRVAEELVLHDVTTGAGNDLERATDLARKMVCEWGMSEKLGPLTFGRKEEEVFLGREMGSKRDFSEQVAIEIDHDVRRLVTENYERAKRILTDNMTSLKALAEALLEKEVLDALEIDQILIQGSSSQTVPA